MKRTSLKAVFWTLVVLCLITFMMYFVIINKSNLVDVTFKELQHLKPIWSSNKGNVTEEESAISPYNTESYSYFMKNKTMSPLTTKLKDTSNYLIPEVFPSTTTMTFNTSLIVQCKESVYIYCVPRNMNPSSKKVINIVYHRRPSWVNADLYNLTSCRVKQCVISDGPVTNETDIVIINGVELSDTLEPPKRWPNQTYILAEWEPPMHMLSDYVTNENSPWNARINLIMSYRVDADVFVPYSHLTFSPKPLHQRPDYYKIAQEKRKTAVWIVSKCNTPNRRWQYVKEMQKYIDVDIFGVCGKPCPRSDSNCYDWTAKYKFYLSFENSLCRDYVTEKYFRLFNQNIYVIPVVRGGVDFHKYFPHFTYINTADFERPKDLALYLKYLASDLQTYSKYLEYKDLYVAGPDIDQMCKVCSFVHNYKLPATKHYNLKQWVDDFGCYSPKDMG